METSEIRAVVREYILKEFLPGEDPEALTDDLQLVSGRILDSLATLRVVAFLEEKFGFEFEAHEVGVQNLDSIDLMVKFVEEKKR
ncbi:MAG: acyl carrier protein [Candidatus Eisenbacteria bacterium]|nr:acyl carrier protein [Candidatus Eisenbacteria bacterium]MCC7140554.1 acyl carrier protein [Candidatus Eisenbacteria bacterium]